MVVQYIRTDDQFDGLRPFHVGQCRMQYSDKGSYNTAGANYPSGAIMSTKAKSHFLDPSEAACKLCGQEGGPVHVLFACPGTLHVRQSIQLGTLADAPNAVRVSGLFPVLPNLGQLRLMLSNTGDQIGYSFAERVHLFTDGSTSFGTSIHFAVSSWAICLAECGSLERTVVDSGALPGALQGNNRAELFAVVRAVETAPSGVVYSDSQYCISGIQRLKLHGWRLADWQKSPHFDLWKRLFLQLRDSFPVWDFVKVVSHMEISTATSSFERWCIVHNGFADSAAKEANKARGTEFWELHQSLYKQ